MQDVVNTKYGTLLKELKSTVEKIYGVTGVVRVVAGKMKKNHSKSQGRLEVTGSDGTSVYCIGRTSGQQQELTVVVQGGWNAVSAAYEAIAKIAARA